MTEISYEDLEDKLEKYEALLDGILMMDELAFNDYLACNPPKSAARWSIRTAIQLARGELE